MSPATDLSLDADVVIGEDEDYILLRVTESGTVTTISTLDEDEAVDLLRETADRIEIDGFIVEQTPRLS
jgi:hypothetical protein